MILGTLTNNNKFEIDGNLINNGSLTNNGDMLLLSTYPKLINNNNLYNYGNIKSNQGSVYLINNGNATNFNSGYIMLKVNNPTNNYGTFNNYGSVYIKPAFSNRYINNYGIINNYQHMSIDAKVFNYNIINNYQNASIDINEGSFVNENAILENNGTLYVGSEFNNSNSFLRNYGEIRGSYIWIVNNNSTIDNYGSIELMWDLTNNHGVINNYNLISGGLVNNVSSSINNHGYLAIRIDRVIFVNNGTIINYDKISFNGPGDGINAVDGIIENYNEISSVETNFNNEGKFINNGKITSGDLNFINYGVVINNNLMQSNNIYNNSIIVNCGTIDATIYGNSLQPCNCYLVIYPDTVRIGEYVTASVFTNSTIDNVRFRWSDNLGEKRNVIDNLEPFEDVYNPDTAGEWTVEAICSDGSISIKTLHVSFLVLPESIIGTIAIIGSSLTIMIAYILKRYR